jgi:hypothetical protein
VPKMIKQIPKKSVRIVKAKNHLCSDLDAHDHRPLRFDDNSTVGFCVVVVPGVPSGVAQTPLPLLKKKQSSLFLLTNQFALLILTNQFSLLFLTNHI